MLAPQLRAVCHEDLKHVTIQGFPRSGRSRSARRIGPTSRKRATIIRAAARKHGFPYYNRSPLMYAVVKTGGKQYKVAPGEKLKVEQIPADVGAEVVLDQVLMVGDGDNVRLGQPTLAGASVKAKVVAHGRGEKVRIFKMRRRKHYQKHQGHRQNYTELHIDAIVG
jgi:large subunit ribosomal protein L21